MQRQNFPVNRMDAIQSNPTTGALPTHMQSLQSPPPAAQAPPLVGTSAPPELIRRWTPASPAVFRRPTSVHALAFCLYS